MALLSASHPSRKFLLLVSVTVSLWALFQWEEQGWEYESVAEEKEEPCDRLAIALPCLCYR